MKLLLGLSIILLLAAGTLYLIRDIWRFMVEDYRRRYALLIELQKHTPEERAEIEARAKAARLAEAKATLLRYKQRCRTTAFYEDTNEVKINPATGAYMLSEMYDMDGEFCPTGGI